MTGSDLCSLGVDERDPVERIYEETLLGILLLLTMIILYRTVYKYICADTHICIAHTYSLFAGPLRLYLQIANIPNSFGAVLYPLLANEIYLPDCPGNSVVVESLVCLSLTDEASSPQLEMAEGSEGLVTWSNTNFSARALFTEGRVPRVRFVCTSAEGHEVNAMAISGI